MNATELLFHPQAARVHGFDELMRNRLADSLDYLAEATAEHLNVSPERLESQLVCLRERPVLPEVGAAYHELVMALQDADLEPAQGLFDDILETIGEDASFQVIPFKSPGADKVSQRYLAQIISDATTPINVLPVEDEDFQRAKGLIDQAFAVLEECSPELHAEMSALLKRVMVGAGPTEKGAFTFDGASAFGLWGAILLNAKEPKDVVDMVQTLAHESCHNLLFGYCIEGKLVLNPDDERYDSPLRSDPRPLDGTFHATFVLARMHYAVHQIADSALLSPELKAKIKSESQARETQFRDGLHTLKAHARYTPEGQALMNAAEAYMDRAGVGVQ